MAFKNNEVLGSVSFVNISNESAEFGIYKNPFSNVKGAGTILTIMANHYAKNFLKIKKLDLIVQEKNIIALNLYRKLGFNVMNKKLINKLTFLTMTKLIR